MGWCVDLYRKMKKVMSNKLLNRHEYMSRTKYKVVFGQTPCQAHINIILIPYILGTICRKIMIFGISAVGMNRNVGGTTTFYKKVKPVISNRRWWALLPHRVMRIKIRIQKIKSKIENKNSLNLRKSTIQCREHKCMQKFVCICCHLC